MQISEQIYQEAQFLLQAFLTGVILLVIYDFFRVLRRIFPHGTFVIAIEDLLYWFGSSIFIFVVLYKENSGIIRGFAIGGIVIGMFCYNMTISPFIVKFISKFIKTIAGILKTILGVFFRPFAKILKWLFGKSKKVSKKSRKVSKFLKKILIKTIKEVKIRLYKL